ncbi:MAG: hypothetical protein OEZ59_05185 [Deltaproteobacteria bacterium]|nr:hypothetical protein [Deltaproteobacteria bacterium]
MVNKTVKSIGNHLQKLTNGGMSMTKALDILSRKARTIEELVVVEVMREAHQEILKAEALMAARYADSSTRSARMPSMALSR